jgi:hypothetical protein
VFTGPILSHTPGGQPGADCTSMTAVIPATAGRWPGTPHGGRGSGCRAGGVAGVGHREAGHQQVVLGSARQRDLHDLGVEGAADGRRAGLLAGGLLR